jgi:hypothetical protein
VEGKLKSTTALGTVTVTIAGHSFSSHLISGMGGLLVCHSGFRLTTNALQQLTGFVERLRNESTQTDGETRRIVAPVGRHHLALFAHLSSEETHRRRGRYGHSEQCSGL